MTDTDTIVPIRALDEGQALAWLRNQPGGRTTLSGAELARRWGWDRRRVSRRLREWKKAGVVRGRGSSITVVENAPPTVPEGETVAGDVARIVRPVVATNDIEKINNIKYFSTFSHERSERRTTIDLAAYAAAIGLASCAAFFSIKGMTVLFPGSRVAIVAMTATMEAAKLVTAGWLARRWRATAWVWRVALASFVLGLAVINASGVYAQLVAAHLNERGAAIAAVETQTADLDARIEVTARTVADLDARVNQIDSAIAEATRRGGEPKLPSQRWKPSAGLVRSSWRTETGKQLPLQP
jgi:hypothetical protein